MGLNLEKFARFSMGLIDCIDYEDGGWLAGSQEEIEEQFADTRPHINRQNRLGHIVVAVEIVDHRRPETVVTEEKPSSPKRILPQPNTKMGLLKSSVNKSNPLAL